MVDLLILTSALLAAPPMYGAYFHSMSGRVIEEWRVPILVGAGGSVVALTAALILAGHTGADVPTGTVGVVLVNGLTAHLLIRSEKRRRRRDGTR